MEANNATLNENIVGCIYHTYFLNCIEMYGRQIRNRRLLEVIKIQEQIREIKFITANINGCIGIIYNTEAMTTSYNLKSPITAMGIVADYSAVFLAKRNGDISRFDLSLREDVNICNVNSKYVRSIKGIVQADNKLMFIQCNTLYQLDLNTTEVVEFKMFKDELTYLIQKGQLSIVGCNDGSIYICDVNNRDLVIKISASQSAISSLYTINDIVISGGFDSRIRVWDINKPDLALSELTGHTDAISCIQGDNEFIYSGSWDKTIRVWTGDEHVGSLIGHQSVVTAITHLSKARLASASNDLSIIIWNTEKYIPIKTLKGHSCNITGLSLYKQRYLISTSVDSSLKVWDIHAANQSIKAHTGAVLRILKMTETEIITSGNDRMIIYWSLIDFKCQKEIKTEKVVVDLCKLNNRTFISYDEGPSFRIWDYKTAKCIHRIEIEYSPETKLSTLRLQRIDNDTFLISTKSYLQLYNKATLIDKFNSVDGFLVLDSNTFVVFAGNKVTILYTNKSQKELIGHEKRVISGAKLTGERIVTGGWDSFMLVWDIKTGQSVQKIDHSFMVITTICVIGSEKIAVSSSMSDNICIYDLKNSGGVRILFVPSRGINHFISL
jgi:WD40 repeat protein